MLRVVLCTFPSDETAHSVARTLVDEKLVACVNVLPGVRSFYRWQGKVCDEAEVLAIMKTSPVVYSNLEKRLAELHPYDTPEIVGLSPEACLPSYLSWVLEQTKPG